MWVFLNNAMLSMVQHRDRPAYLMVRARRKEDLTRTFPLKKAGRVTYTPDADYPYRCIVKKEVVAQMLAANVLGINYDNFKNGVEEDSRHDWYMDVWLTGVRHNAKGEW